jgi:hypothetical protein
LVRRRRAKKPLEDTSIETFRATSPDGRCDAVLVIEDANCLGLYVVRAGRRVEGKRPVVYLVRAMPEAGAPIEWVDRQTVRFHGKLDDISYEAVKSVYDRTPTSVTLGVR